MAERAGLATGDIQTLVAEAVAAIRGRTPQTPLIGMVLGSGLGGLVDDIENPVPIAYGTIPHFPTSSVAGHQGTLVLGTLAGRDVVAMVGRVHFYEGYTMAQVAFPTRVLAGLGVKTMIITNAAGGINETFQPGQVVVIRDHINFMGDNPLRGGSHFIDLTEAYSRKLRNLAKSKAAELDMELPSGVYLATSGPCYETPAEIQAMRVLGADLVGMSTVPEVIMANTLGLKVLGLSMVTNLAAGMSGQPLSHQEVIETTELGKASFKRLVRNILAAL